ncbi:MAG: hypothetical protein P1U80_05765 [Pseudomonadales bacterium]|nr:hypothetical protein [Pseudomonadales bacterium]
MNANRMAATVALSALCFLGGCEEAAEKSKNVISEMAEKANDAIDDATEDAAHKAESIRESASETLEEGYDNAKKSSKNAFESVKDKTSELIEEAKN